MIVGSNFRRGRNPGDPAPFLARSRLFRDASPGLRMELARSAQRIVTARGSLVYEAGEFPGGLFIVGSGYIALSVHRNRDRKVVGICGPGDSFGEDCIVGNAGAVSAQVVSAGLLVHLPQQSVLEAMDRHPTVARCILRSTRKSSPKRW